ncbi:MAG: DNA translocase FtsK 4TM domain-containing protein [Myxococcota bacterium]
MGISLSARLVEECAGVALLGASLLAALALASYVSSDPALERAVVDDRVGVVGAVVAALLFRALGHGAFVAVAGVGVLGARLLAARGLPRPTSRFWLASALLLASVATLPPLLQEATGGGLAQASGGALGEWLAARERWLVGTWGGLLLNGAFALIGVLSAIGVSGGSVLSAVGASLGWLGAAAAAGVLQLTRWLLGVAGAVRHGAVELALGVQRGVRSVTVWKERRARRARVAAARTPAFSEPDEAEGEAAAGRPATARGRRGDPTIVDHEVDRPAPQQRAFRFSDAPGPYALPDVSIFQRPPAGARSYDRDSLIMKSRILEKKLQDFGVAGRVVTVHPGPVITMYEFEPASGIKVNRIVSLADDLALALRALSVRIVAPLPAKSVVGIEVANPERDVVYVRDLLEGDAVPTDAKLDIALGKDIFGNPVHADLGKMPHLLVAGATGTGKSVFLNVLLCSILCRLSPDQLKLLLVDPKLLELSLYEGIPHLIADVVTNPKRAAAALAGIVRIMDERYQMMAALGARSIEQFNTSVEKELSEGRTTGRLKRRPGEEEGREFELKRFPYIVVVIDELADLMVVSARDVEEALQRLAQMARAAGIHLVLATQRPSVDVLTGVIKANFPARISFQVSSRTDSRTILDQNGAEHLLGQGDMLFLPPGTSKLQRIHGAYVSEDEVAELAKALRSQGAPAFDEKLINPPEGEAGSDDRDDEVDEMYDRAIAIITDSRNASISYLQRRLKVGYNRAARMIEQMEADGIVGRQEGSKARDVYVRPASSFE